ncbi:hypothetical protein [Arthrobacter sp. TMS2-4]
MKACRGRGNVTLTDHRRPAAVRQYVIVGGGHTWPGGKAADFPRGGVTTTEISANDLIWNFFERRTSR